MQQSATALDWDDVRLFLALGRARTVGDAAATLGVDASTVSRRLAALEDRLAASLFDRGRGGVSATKAAEDLLPVAEEIEAMMNRFLHAADGLEREVSGLVRITCPADVAEVIVMPALHALLARHPSLRIALDPGEAVLDLTRREADLALRVVRPKRGDLVVLRVAQMRWVLAAAPSLARTTGTLRAWDHLRWISWGERLGHIAPARWLSTHVPSVDPVLRSDNLAVQLAGVHSGLGAALVPEPSLAHYGLVPIKLHAALRRQSSSWPTDELFLVTHRALRNVPRVSAVWQELAGTFRHGLSPDGAR